MHESASFPSSKVLFSRLTTHVRLRQLQLLLALQQCGSVLQASASLNMSQSAATQALAELERVLDMRLFERHARGMRPTAAGQALIDTVRSVMVELEVVTETLAAIRMGASAALRLGTIPAGAQAIVSQLLARFYAECPEVYVDVQEGGGSALLALLISGGLDVVFCRQPALLPDQFVFEPLLPDDAVVVAASNHPLVRKKQVGLRALEGARWVLPTANIAVREIFDNEVKTQLPDASWFPISSVSLPVLESMLHHHRAVALVPRSILPPLSTSGPAAQLSILDTVENAEAFRLAPLGAVYRREGAPRLLLEMLKLWRLPGQAALLAPGS